MKNEKSFHEKLKIVKCPKLFRKESNILEGP